MNQKFESPRSVSASRRASAQLLIPSRTPAHEFQPLSLPDSTDTVMSSKSSNRRNDYEPGTSPGDAGDGAILSRLMNVRFFHSAFCTLLLLCGGCGSRPARPTVEGVRSEVAKVLKKDAAKIDVAKPLVAQGADELDIVEIVMALEETFKVKIPDGALGKTVGEASKTLTVQKLTEIVSTQQKAK